MSSTPIAVPPSVPKELSGLIHLNAAYSVLVCRACRQAVRPSKLDQHLRRSHRVVSSIRKQVRKYVATFNGNYEDSTDQTPGDGSEAQAELPVVACYECVQCEGERFRTSSAQRWARHRFTVHGLPWAEAKETPSTVFMQTWFMAGRQKYWRVLVNEAFGAAAAADGDDNTREPQHTIAVKVAPRGKRGEAMAMAPAARRERNRRRATDTGVQRHAECDEGCGSKRGDRGTADTMTTTTEVRVTANSSKRRATSVAGEDRRSKRVRFAAEVEIGGLEGLEQQLKRWAKECVVCYLVGGDENRSHTIWECRQVVAEEARADSREMEARMRAVGARGGCPKCRVPQTMCAWWQWGGRWKDSVGECQYRGVLISTMMAMARLGRAEGRVKIGALLRLDKVDPRGPDEEVSRWFGRQIWWEGVDAGQVLLAFMKLARINGLLTRSAHGCWLKRGVFA